MAKEEDGRLAAVERILLISIVTQGRDATLSAIGSINELIEEDLKVLYPNGVEDGFAESFVSSLQRFRETLSKAFVESLDP